jgi:polyisoprenoid-binding protein YceI
MIRSALKPRRTAGIAALALIGAGLCLPFLPTTPTVGRAVAEDAPAASGAYTVDPVHSAVLYRIKHQDVAYSWGRFNEFSGTFLLDRATPENSKINITIDTKSVDSGNGDRDKHLRSPDFFNVAQFPTATFTSTSVRKTGETVYEVTGDFTLNGTTKAITVTIANTGEGKGRGGVSVAGIESVFDISRADFSLGTPGGVSDDVRITVSLEGGRE